MTQRYQRGSLQRQKRTGWENVWAWRCRIKDVMKVETHSTDYYPAKTAMWQHIEPAIRALNNKTLNPVLPLPERVAPTMCDVIAKYLMETVKARLLACPLFKKIQYT